MPGPVRRRLVTVVPAVLVGILGVAGPSVALDPRDAPLRREIGRVMTDPSVTASTAKVAAVVADGSTGATVYARNPTLQLAPASSMKVLTAMAGLRYLGPGFRWRTELWAAPRSGATVPGNLYVKGFGDPTLMTSDLAALAKAVRAAGVTRVTGAVVADASYFDDANYNPGWSTSYLSQYYAAQISALTLAPSTDYDSGTVIVNYRPGATTSQAATLWVGPSSAASYVTLVNRVRTVAAGSTTSVTATRTPGTNTVTVTGQVPLRRSDGRTWVTVHEPALLAATVLRVELARAGVTVSGGVERGTVPGGTVRYATDTSMTLAQVLVPFLKLSNNMHAEHITKTLGTRYGRPGNWPDGIAHLRAYAAGRGVDLTGSGFVDGSGLARANHLSAQQLVQLLAKAPREPWFATFRAALPVAGTQPVRWTGGTLASRMVGTPAAGNLRAKNGSLTGVTSLAGYVSGADGRPYVFAMVSSFSGTSPRPVEDRLGVLLARWRMTNP